MTKAPVKTASEAIEKLKEKDGEANNESARTNEILAQRADELTGDALKATLSANDPSLSRSAYTSHKSGFNEDIEPKDVAIPNAKPERQTKAVSE